MNPALTHNLRLDAARAARGARAWGRVLARAALPAAPVALKVAQTGGGYAFGDVLTQQLGPLWPAPDWPTKHNPGAHDLRKTALMAGVGAALGAPLSLALYGWMHAACPPAAAAGGAARLLLEAAKFVVDQLAGCVLWQGSYLAVSRPYRETLAAFVAQQRAAAALRSSSGAGGVGGSHVLVPAAC